MCWNENISLNTFIFGTATMLFIWYNNTYTQYTTPEFKDIRLYLLFFSVICIQLIEYFLWKSIHNKDRGMNKMFSIIGWVVIYICQPSLALLVIPNKYDLLKYALAVIYFSVLSIVLLYKYFYNPIVFKTTIDHNRHLYWDWTMLYNYEQIIYVWYFITFCTLFLSYPVITALCMVLLTYSYFIYKNTGSMWCWLSNSVLMYLLFKLLFVLPFLEYNQLC
jgi:hypothetical protein